jgi:hypothetical protein
MKKIILTIATAMISVFATAQISNQNYVVAIDSIESIFMESQNFQGKEFKILSKMNPSDEVVSQGFIFFLPENRAPIGYEMLGYVCYFPKEIWNNQSLKTMWMQNNSNWIPLLVTRTAYDNITFLTRDCEIEAMEYAGGSNKYTGYWYFNKGLLPENNGFGDFHGMWWNGKQFNQGFKTLYIRILN